MHFVFVLLFAAQSVREVTVFTGVELAHGGDGILLSIRLQAIHELTISHAIAINDLRGDNGFRTALHVVVVALDGVLHQIPATCGQPADSTGSGTLRSAGERCSCRTGTGRNRQRISELTQSGGIKRRHIGCWILRILGRNACTGSGLCRCGDDVHPSRLGRDFDMGDFGTISAFASRHARKIREFVRRIGVADLRIVHGDGRAGCNTIGLGAARAQNHATDQGRCCGHRGE